MQKKKNNSTAVQLGLMAVCFLLILALAFFLGKINRKNKPDYENGKLVQLEVPRDDATVVVFETTKGTFKAVIYEDKVPEFCKYFKGLVKDGYYDGTYVFGVEKGAYFLGGSKAPDGVDTSDTDSTTMTKELSADLWPLRGALISYGGRDNKFFSSTLSGSRLMFVNSIEFTDEIVSQLDAVEGNKDVNEAFKERGGVPNFSQQYTVFGQVYDGFDTYDKICDAGVGDSSNIVPTEEIKLTKVYLSTYAENKNDSFFNSSQSSSQSK